MSWTLATYKVFISRLRDENSKQEFGLTLPEWLRTDFIKSHSGLRDISAKLLWILNRWLVMLIAEQEILRYPD